MTKQAFLLAAGLGSRMRELTKDIPKPMIEVAGQSMITRLIDQLFEHGVTRLVINLFYKGQILMDHVKTHLGKHPATIEVFFSEESELLDTGGGIINALKYLKPEPFFVVNNDSIFIGKENPFSLLDKQWQDSMKALFLLSPLEKTIGYDGKGDFSLDETGQLVLSENSPYVYIGAHIVKPELFRGYEAKKIKLMEIYNQFLSNKVYQGLHGTIYPGQWLHVGTPEALEEANDYIYKSS
jgi:MurNAc alpha-1-phosphate uridylyltransferase